MDQSLITVIVEPLHTGKTEGWTSGDKKMCFLKKNKIFDAELWAILNALDIATQETLNANNTPMTIFCDLQKALQAIQHPSYKENWFLRRQIYHKAKNLQSTRHLIIY